jgi:transposase
MTEVTVYTERVDDIPLLVGQQQAIGLADVIDEVVPRHGNRAGLSLGNLVVGWLTFILSESDHRLSYVETWAAQQQQTLSRLFAQPVTPRDFTDDRLGDALQALSDEVRWAELERRLNQRLIRVLALPTDTARVDTTSVAMYHDQEQSCLAAFGHSKDHRPDLAQLKALLVTLDPLAMPLVTLVTPGNRADDGLYLPAIAQARQSVAANTPLLFVGDSKMEARYTRAQIAHANDYYLLPLSHKGDQAQLLADLVAEVTDAAQPAELIDVYPSGADPTNETKRLAQGKEFRRTQEVNLDGTSFQWQERLLLVHSPTLAASGVRGLQQRLRETETQLLALTPAPGRGKRVARDLTKLQAAAEAILARHRVADYLHLDYQALVHERMLRAYGDRPARTEVKVRYQLTVTRDAAAIAQAEKQMGWRLYATNAPVPRLSLPEAVRTYRGGVPTIERDFARLKGRPLGLRPLFVQRDDHVTGLVHLLSLALRILTLTEYLVRRSLQEEQASLAGLYPGNPKQTTDRPTTERLLRAFEGVTLSCIDLPGQQIRHLTPLSPLQSRILQLLRLSDSVYTSLAQAEPNSS